MKQKNKSLTVLLARVSSWPDRARTALNQLALEIEAELGRGVYHATPEELAGVDRGPRAAAEGKFASDEEVDAVFAK